ncbi:MAG: hypothetical protein P4L22_00225 [Candidatus Babeliales bacterium]|nr:hypothetical protein [Candidatus Babeliales bacterium]
MKNFCKFLIICVFTIQAAEKKPFDNFNIFIDPTLTGAYHDESDMDVNVFEEPDIFGSKSKQSQLPAIEEVEENPFEVDDNLQEDLNLPVRNKDLQENVKIFDLAFSLWVNNLQLFPTNKQVFESLINEKDGEFYKWGRVKRKYIHEKLTNLLSRAEIYLRTKSIYYIPRLKALSLCDSDNGLFYIAIVPENNIYKDLQKNDDKYELIKKIERIKYTPLCFNYKDIAKMMKKNKNEIADIMSSFTRAQFLQLKAIYKFKASNCCAIM